MYIPDISSLIIKINYKLQENKNNFIRKKNHIDGFKNIYKNYVLLY